MQVGASNRTRTDISPRKSIVLDVVTLLPLEGVRSSVTQKELRVERSPLRWLRHLLPPGWYLPREVFQAYPTGRKPPSRARTHRRDCLWAGLGNFPKSWRKRLGRGTSGHLCLGCCSPNLAPDTVEEDQISCLKCQV